MKLKLPEPATRYGWLLRRGAGASASAYNYRHNRGASVGPLTVKERYFTYVRACLYGGRPEILFPVRLNFPRSLRVVSISSDLVGHDAASRGGVHDFRVYLSAELIRWAAWLYNDSSFTLRASSRTSVMLSSSSHLALFLVYSLFISMCLRVAV
jgi:hypothetical protein